MGFRMIGRIGTVTRVTDRSELNDVPRVETQPADGVGQVWCGQVDRLVVIIYKSDVPYFVACKIKTHCLNYDFHCADVFDGKREMF